LKVFWSILVLLSIAVAVAFLMPGTRDATPTVMDTAGEIVVKESTTGTDPNAIAQAPTTTEAPATAATPKVPHDITVPTPAESARTRPGPDTSAPAPALQPEPKTTTPAADETPKGIAPATTPGTSSKPFTIIDSKIETKPDGSLLVDDRYVIKGDGTKERPYEVTWELLTSAEKLYNPREGKKQMPSAVAMLDGKHVRITGYVAFPLYVQDPREYIVMLNQWDGCCIGVPPTPFDAIEVQTNTAIRGDDRFAVSGTVSGILGVKPYTVGDWLVGLYVMDDAALKPGEFGNFGGS